MAVADRTYTDPTAGAINALLGLGGSKESVKTNTTVDPAVLDMMHQLLNSQLAGTTPEGAAAIIQAIFQRGLEQVPGLATTYGAAAGARTSNNSGMQLAMQDMFAKLAREGALQVRANQDSASQTAARLADASKTTQVQKTTNPKASFLQLAPFALANMDKLKGVFSQLGLGGSGAGVNVAASAENPIGADNFSQFFSPESGGNFALPGVADSAPDAASVFTDLGPSVISDAASGIGDGVSSLLSNVGDAGTAIADAGSSLLDSVQSAFGFNKGGYVSKKIMMKPANTKAKGYAEGGEVKGITQADSRVNLMGDDGKQIRGVTYDDNTAAALDLLRGIAGVGGDIGAPKSNSTSTTATSPKKASSPASTSDGFDSAGSSGVGEGIATGEVGDPASNNAAIGGMAALGLSMGTGVPAALIGLAMTQMGIPNTTMSPIGKGIQTLVNAITGKGDMGSVSGSPTGMGMTAPDGAIGMSSPSVSVGNGISTQGASTAPGGIAAASDSVAAATSGIGEGMGIGVSGDADGVGGASTGDSSGSAAAGGTGDGVGGDFNTGGSVSGPQGKDVIPAFLTDGEFVIKNPSVKKLGVPLLHAMNENPDAFMGALKAIMGPTGSSAAQGR
jgi:hypothetical protein